MTTDDTKSTLDPFLEALAARTPAPGGGAVAAVAGALAAALGRMVAAYSLNAKTPQPLRSRLTDLENQLRTMDELQRAFVTQDGQAYLTMTETGRVARNDPTAVPAFQRAVLAAIGVPMEIATVATGTLAVLDAAREEVGTYMVSDLAVAAVVAGAAVDAARYMILVNLPSIDDRATRDRITRDLNELARRSANHRASIASFVTARLEPHE